MDILTLAVSFGMSLFIGAAIALGLHTLLRRKWPRTAWGLAALLFLFFGSAGSVEVRLAFYLTMLVFVVCAVVKAPFPKLSK